MSKCIAYTMKLHNIPPSLVVNLDQTGPGAQLLVPSDDWTTMACT